MKKRGFTLIELLAVIVILAIIALIATPIVMNVIENSRKGAAERSAENYMGAVETAVGTERIDGNILDGEYIIQSDGSICPKAGCEIDGVDKKVKIDMSGDKPSSGSIFIDNGIVTTSSTMIIKDYTVSYDETKKTYVASKAGEENEGEENTSITVYRWSEETISIGDTIDPSTYTTDPTTLEENFYLKHKVENNIVTESYVCAIFDGEPACVQGGKDENGASYYNANKSILEDKSLSCDLGKSRTDCYDGSIALIADSNAWVYTGDDYAGCSVYGDGSSSCIRI